MEKSETIGKLAEALAKAQGEECRFEEGRLIPLIVRKIKGKFKGNKGPLTKRFFEKIAFGASDCWYFVGCIDDFGYGHIGVKNGRAHRVSWEIHNGPIPSDMCVLHRCDVRNCVNPEHLFLGTQEDNISDMVQKGRNVNVPMYGERNPMSKLTNKEVVSIREMKDSGRYLQIELSRIFDVSPMTISRIVRRETWNEQI